MNIKFTGAQVGATNTQYTAGDLLGAKLTLTNAVLMGDVILNNVTIQDLTKQDAAIDLLIFDADPSTTTFTDNSALDVDDADLPKIIGKVSIAAADYADFADNSAATVTPNIVLQASSGPTLYVCMVARGTPTYVANELSISLGFVR